MWMRKLVIEYFNLEEENTNDHSKMNHPTNDY